MGFMKKIGEIFKDIGFNPESSTGAKKALVKYLINQARFQDEIRGPETTADLPPLDSSGVENKKAAPEEQLSFFDTTGTED